MRKQVRTRPFSPSYGHIPRGQARESVRSMRTLGMFNSDLGAKYATRQRVSDDIIRVLRLMRMRKS